MNRTIILISYTCSGHSLLDDLKIIVIFNLCCWFGHVSFFKSLHDLAASYVFTHSPLDFFPFYNVSPVWLDHFYRSTACGNTTWMPSSASSTVFPSILSIRSHAQTPASLFCFSLLFPGSFDLSFVDLHSLRRKLWRVLTSTPKQMYN